MILEFTQAMENFFGKLDKFIEKVFSLLVALLLVGFFGFSYFVGIVTISPWIKSIDLGILLTGALFLYVGFVRYFPDRWILPIFFISWLLTLCAALFNLSLLANVLLRIAIIAFYWVVVWTFKDWFRN